MASTVQRPDDTNRARGDLRDDRSFLAAVLDSTADGILAVDLEGKFVGFNQKFIEMWQLPREMVEAGKNDNDALQLVLDQLKDPQVFLEKVRNLYSRVDATSFDTFEFKDGHVFERYSQPQVQDGNIVGRVWSFRDVTDRHKAEAAHRSSEERLRIALSASQMGVWDWNIASGEVLWCEHVDAVLGVKLGEFPNKLEAYKALVHPDDLNLVDKTLKDIVEGKIESFRIEHRAISPDEKLKWLEVWGQVKSMEEGSLHLVGAILDITAAKQREDEILRLNRECESKVQIRTQQLEHAYQDLEAFSYSVSHDLRAPLRHINSFVGLLLNEAAGKLDAQDIDQLKRIESASQHLTELVESLLDFSKLGNKELRKAAIDLDALIGEIQQEFRPEVAGRKIVWRIQHLPRIVGDPALIRTAFLNLISNAIKFTRGREPAHIEIGSQTFPQDNTKVAIYVRDDGIGFDMTRAGKLFAVFQRLHQFKSFEGTGVGLAIVKRIVERHGGEVWAEAKLGEGATFYLTLPLARNS